MAFSDPQKNVQQFELREGMHVADFGAGTGHYTIAAARAVGDTGRVYAVEIQKDLVQRVKNLAQAEHLGNVEVLWGDIEVRGGTKLAQGSMDGVILANTLFQTEGRSVVLEEVKRVLKPGGKLFFVEWADSFGGLGPRSEDVLPPETSGALLKESGFVEKKQLSDAGDHHYGLVLKKP